MLISGSLFLISMWIYDGAEVRNTNDAFGLVVSASLNTV